MKTVIIAGGEGLRMRPLTQNLHKSMLPLLNRPLIEHIMEYLKKEGITEIIFALNYRYQDIKNYFLDTEKNFGLKINYVVETSPLGTAGAVKNARHYLDEQPFFVLNGDILFRMDLRQMMKNHLLHKAVASIALAKVEDTSAYGLVKLNIEGRVTEFIEKSSENENQSGMINAGIYILSPQVLRLVPEAKYYMFETGLFPELIRHGEKMYGFPSNSYWIDIGTPQNYLKVHRDMLSNEKFGMESLNKESLLCNRASCYIHPEGQLSGSIALGKRCTIGRRARIIGPTSIGNGCQMGDETVVESSILWEEVKIREGAFIKNSIIGSGCIVGERAKINNGCILGDGAEVPEGQVLLPNTRIPF